MAPKLDLSTIIWEVERSRAWQSRLGGHEHSHLYADVNCQIVKYILRHEYNDRKFYTGHANNSLVPMYEKTTGLMQKNVLKEPCTGRKPNNFDESIKKALFNPGDDKMRFENSRINSGIQYFYVFPRSDRVLPRKSPSWKAA